jgi:uncharacterized SAM-binding protein YcdF (DUF218 family)
LNIRYFLWYLLSPSQLIILGLLAGALLLAAGLRRSGRVLVGGAALALLAFGLLPGARYLARPLEGRFPQPELPSSIAGIILLTGAEKVAASEASGLPQLGSHGNRYIAMLQLAQRYPSAPIVVSGEPLRQQGKPELGTQTAIARAIIDAVGVDPARIVYEQRSRDTCDNASNTRRLVTPAAGDRWVLVTSAIHMPRAVACFRAAGWDDVIPQPDAYQSAVGMHRAGTFRIVDNLDLLDDAVHEWLGLAYYRLAGRTSELFPAPRIDPGAARH